MLNIVMPLAGKGQRFKDAGYTTPKPLIDVLGRPMWQVVCDNVLPSREHSLNVIHRGDIQISGEYFPTHGFNTQLLLYEETQGAVDTILAFERNVIPPIDNYDPLLIVNGDQYIDGLDIEDFLTFASKYHGCIMTFPVGPNEPPKWSYVAREWIVGDVGFDPGERVGRVAEKQPISREATCGLYWFRHGRDFLRAAHAMITKDIRVNGEFYVCPVYNEMIAEGLTVGAYNVGEGRMHGLGTPEDLEKFVKHGPLAKGTAA